VNLNKFTINTSLVPSRNAVLGVVLGIVAMWLVFDHLWAKTSSESVRSLLLGTIRNVANFNAVSATASQEANQRLATESSKINQDFDKLRDLADLYAFESFPKKPQESLINQSIVMLLPELRALLLVKTGLLQHKNLMVASEGDAPTQEVEKYASNVLQSLANAIEREAPEQLSSSNLYAEELRERVQSEDEKSERMNAPQKHTEMRLCASLLEIASHLERRARLNFVVETGGKEVAGNWPIVRTEADGLSR
jgi:multidrug resistance protein MdtO